MHSWRLCGLCNIGCWTSSVLSPNFQRSWLFFLSSHVNYNSEFGFLIFALEQMTSFQPVTRFTLSHYFKHLYYTANSWQPTSCCFIFVEEIRREILLLGILFLRIFTFLLLVACGRRHTTSFIHPRFICSQTTHGHIQQARSDLGAGLLFLKFAMCAISNTLCVSSFQEL